MTKQVPDYLKVYDGEDAPVVQPPPVQPQLIERLSHAFQQATGHQLPTLDPADQTPSIQPSCASLPEESATDASAAGRLADEIGELLAELKRTQRALWQREGELAAAIPLVVRPEEERGQLAERLQAVLRGAAQAVDCQAAGLYLLDDDTRFLKLRSSWGLPEGRFVAEPRRLRGSKADLEALTGHAVVLERAARFEPWNAPEEFGSAVCVPVSTATVPLGTLWVFGQPERSFTDEQVHIVEIVAGRLATELEREILLRDRMDANLSQTDGIAETTSWQRASWQDQVELAGWQLAALPSFAADEKRWSVDGCCPYAFEDGRISLTLAHSHESSMAGALTSATFSGAAQLVRTTLDPANRLNHINDAMATLSAGDQACSALAVTLGPQDDKFPFCAAGHVSSFIIRPHGWEQIGQPATPVGVTADAGYRAAKVRVEPGDTVLMVVAAPPRHTRTASDRYLEANDLAELFLRHHHLSAAKLSELAEHSLAANPTVWPHHPALLIARREL